MHFQWSLLRETFSAWDQHEAPRVGAALAFYSILSLAPLVILVMAVAAILFGQSSAQTHLLREVESMIGRQGAESVKMMIEQARQPASGAFASIAGIVTLLVGASGVFAELRSALNKIWVVTPRSANGYWGMVRQHFFSFGMVLAVGFLLLISLAVSAALAGLGKFFDGFLPLPEVALSALNFTLSLTGTAVLFALIFKYVPETKISWREIWPGATATSLLFTIGKSLIGLYLGKAAVGSAYGAAGSLVVVIVWVYYSAMIFLFGAEFTRVLGSRSQTSGATGAIVRAASEPEQAIRPA